MTHIFFLNNSRFQDINIIWKRKHSNYIELIEQTRYKGFPKVLKSYCSSIFVHLIRSSALSFGIFGTSIHVYRQLSKNRPIEQINIYSFCCWKLLLPLKFIYNPFAYFLLKKVTILNLKLIINSTSFTFRAVYLFFILNI
jgi:hypothetical protein